MKANSPSKRLRSALWILWDKKKVSQDFDEWYAEQVEQVIRRVKEAIKQYE